MESDTSFVLKNELKHVKDENKEPHEIDGITGATVSSEAVAKALNKSAQNMIPLIVNNIEVIRNR